MTPSELGQLFLYGKVAIAMVLAVGGLGALFLGHRYFKTRRAQARDGTLIQYGQHLRISVGSLGALLMLTAWGWGWLAKTTLPSEFSASHDGDLKIAIAPEIPTGPPFYVSSASAGTLECRRPEPDVIDCNEVRAGQKCGPPPAPIDGLGRLQIARVERKTEQNGADVAKNLLLSARKVLQDRGQKDWAIRLMGYPAPTDARGVHRVTFNNVAPEVVVPMCAWLKCEGWTYGPCEFVSKDSD